ncbi:MAG TPA: RDD family protein [Vicinamibacterales bacterium]|nr:RDD family protein [Vicinamibacterales bacterium]
MTTTSRRILLVTLAAAATSLSAPLSAQDVLGPVRYPAPAVRVGQDLLVRAGQEIRQGVVVAGSATIDGRVRRDLFVWLGDVQLSSTAIIEGSLVVVAGNVIVAPGAMVNDDLVVVGGTITRPDAFEPGREQVIVGFPKLGEGLRGLVPWITGGLLLGRPIVPGLGWMWQIIGIAFALGLVLSLLFHGSVTAASRVVIERPLSVLLTGVLVLLLSGPLLVIVGATIVGLAVIPVVFCAMLAAWTIGKVGVARGIGHRMIGQTDADSRPQSVRSFVIGFAVITAAYMVPVLGFVTWSLVSVFGLGAAMMAMMSALRREYPAKERAAKSPPPAPSAPPPGPPRGPGALVTPATGPAMSASDPLPPEADVFAEPAPEPPRASARPASVATGLLGYPRAGFLDRAAGFALDCVLVAMVTALFNFQDEWYLFLLLVYFLAFWTWQGTTLGGIVVGLRVVRTDGSPLRFVDALIRALSSLFSFGVLAIGVFWMIQDPERQTWHDKIAGTYVVKVPRELVLANNGQVPSS